MTVTAQKSTQVTVIDAGKRNYASDYGGVMRCYRFDHVQSGAGDATSTIELVRLPPGKFNLLLWSSQLEWTDLGSSSQVIDVGYKAYTAPDGTAVTVSANAFDNDIAATSAGHAALGSDLAAKSGGMYAVDSRDGVTIFATIGTAAIPDAAELHGYLLVSQA